MTFIEFAQLFGDFTIGGTSLFAVGISTLILALIAIPCIIGIMCGKKFEDIPGTKYAKAVGYTWYGYLCMVTMVFGMLLVGALILPWALNYSSHFNSCSTVFSSRALGATTIEMPGLLSKDEHVLVDKYLNTNPINITICQERETLNSDFSEPYISIITIDKNNSLVRRAN